MTDLAKAFPIVVAWILFWAAPFVHGNRVLNNPQPGGGYTVLASHDFEGTGEEGWGFNNSPDFDDQLAPSPLSGNESLNCGTSATTRADSPVFTDQSELWVYFIIHMDNASPSVNTDAIRFRADAGQMGVDFGTRNTGEFRIETTSGGTNGSTDWSATDAHVKLHYKASSGATDGVFEIWVDGDGDFSSGAEYWNVGAHNQTDVVDQIRFQGSSNGPNIYDDILITTGDPGDTPTLP